MSAVDQRNRAAPAAAPEVARRWRPLVGPKTLKALRVLVGGVIIFGSWEWISVSRDLSFWMSQPTRIAEEALDWVVTGRIWPHLITTLEAVAYGFVLGSVVAVAAALLMHELKTVHRVVNPFVIAVYSLPKVALAPIFIVWFGIGLTPKVMLAGIITFFIVFYQLLDALQSVSRNLLDAVRVMGADRWETYRKIIAPSSRHWLVHALRLAFPKAFTGAIIGEIIAANRGVGYLARYHSGIFDATGTLTALLFMLAITLPIHYLFALGRGRAELGTDTDAGI